MWTPTPLSPPVGNTSLATVADILLSDLNVNESPSHSEALAALPSQ